jgi:hypothetical protein
MSKAIEESVVLPDINKQIEYMKHLRKDVLPFVEQLQRGVDMFMAIEQSLIAARLLGGRNLTSTQSEKIFYELNTEYKKILNAFGIKETSVRIEVLRALSSTGAGFTVSELCKLVGKKRVVSKTAVVATLGLFKERGLINESQSNESVNTRRRGRPELKYYLSDNAFNKKLH